MTCLDETVPIKPAQSDRFTRWAEEAQEHRRTHAVDAARAVPGIVDVVMTAKPDQRVEPPPEGGSYLGFIFAQRELPAEAVTALRQAHARLSVVIDAPIPVL